MPHRVHTYNARERPVLWLHSGLVQTEAHAKPFTTPLVRGPVSQRTWLNMDFAFLWTTAIKAMLAAARLLARLCIGCALWAMAVAGYRLYLHPLARVPGPRWAAVSNVWHALQVRNGRVAQLAMVLHQTYGDAVRVGPNEVWFNSMEAHDRIYSESLHSTRAMQDSPTLGRRE